MSKALTIILLVGITSITALKKGLSSQTSHLDIQQPGCPKLHGVQPIPDFKRLLGDWRVPFMSSTWMKSLVYSVHQSSSLRTPVLETSCLKVTLLPMPVADTRTNSSLWVVIKSPKTYLKFDIGCEPSDHIDSEWACQELNRTRIGRHSDGFFIYIFQYDFTRGLDYALVVQCIPKRGINWAILTKEKVVDSKIIKHFMVMVRSMGFDVTNFIEFPYEKCYIR